MRVPGLQIGSKAPDFDLPGVDGRNYTLGSFEGKAVVVVMFTCNHCPYVQAYEDRLVALQRDYASKGVNLVAINSNETVNYPEDSFEKMVARAEEKNFNFPYLRDESQSVAAAYGAQCTPEMFLLDASRILRYRGRVDDNWQQPAKVKRGYLREAIDAVLGGRKIKEPFIPAIGCSIKWTK